MSQYEEEYSFSFLSSSFLPIVGKNVHTVFCDFFFVALLLAYSIVTEGFVCKN